MLILNAANIYHSACNSRHAATYAYKYAILHIGYSKLMFKVCTLLLGVFPLYQIDHTGISLSRCLKLYGHEISCNNFQPM